MSNNFNIFSSTGREISTGMQDIIPTNPLGKVVINKLSFSNKEDCTVIINGTDTISLLASTGLEIQFEFPIKSFVIVEAGITFYWIGTV